MNVFTPSNSEASKRQLDFLKKNGSSTSKRSTDKLTTENLKKLSNQERLFAEIAMQDKIRLRKRAQKSKTNRAERNLKINTNLSFLSHASSSNVLQLNSSKSASAALVRGK